MFAFVFWDSKKQLLILHRDGYGIKPLFYARNRHFLVFSSEPAALHASGLFKFSFDIQAIQLFFQFKFIPAPLSPWHGLKSLMPGETIEYWEGKPMHFQIQRETELQIFESLDQAIRAGFEEVIPRHKPTGLMLSGGIDSSLILKHCLEQEVAFEAFSIRFPFGDEEDKADQNAVFHLSKKLEIPIHWVDIDKSHWEEFLNGSGKNVPFVADSAWYLSSKIAGKARQNGLNVLLSGAGADEWFAGYRRHWFFHQWLRYHGFVPESLQRHLLRRFSKLPLFFSPNSQLTASQIWELGLSSGLASLFQKPMEFKRIFGSEVDTLEKALKWDQTQFLPNDVLTISDLATMQHGVEGRFPFLHPFITDFTEAIPALEKIKKGRKWMLKESLLPLVGRPFVERKKRGFGFPIGICLEGPTIRPWLEDILQQNLWTEFFDTEKWNLGKKELLAKPKLWSQEWLMLIRAWQWMQ
jgi:asparagine synthase (glutamine-hydrolysing)